MKKLPLVVIAAALILFSTCDEIELFDPGGEEPGDVIRYTIPSGRHNADQSSFKTMNISHLRFEAMFDSSAIYSTVDRDNQADINKLYGMADCNSPHHVNSARFGWRWFDERLEIWAYAYVRSERKYKFIDTVEINKKYKYEIAFTDSAYVFSVNNTSITLARSCSNMAGGYKLYPYFGGDEPAPHDITIHIGDVE